LQQQDGTVTTNELADRLHAKPASITDMMKKLKVKKTGELSAYQGFRLTAEGSKVALGIIRRHRFGNIF
jgi:DtxR family Mn-dependent transcriptional regulator